MIYLLTFQYNQGAFIFNVANSVKGSTSSKNFPCLLPDESDENCIDSDKKKYLKSKYASEEECKKFIQSLNLKNETQIDKYLKNNKIPDNIPK